MDFMRKRLAANTLLESLSTLLLSQRLTHSSPFAFRYEALLRQYVGEISPYYALVSVVYSCAYTYCVYLVSVERITVVGHFHTSALYIIGDVFRIYVGFLLIFFLNLDFYSKKDKYALLYTSLNEIDQRSDALSTRKDLSGTRIFHALSYSLMTVMFLWIVCVDVSITKSGDQSPSFALWMSIYNPGIVNALFVLLYVNIIQYFIFYIQLVNRELINICNSKAHSLCVVFYTNELHSNASRPSTQGTRISTVKIVWKTYDQLCDCVGLFNEIFSIKILIIIGICFVSIVFTSFYSWTAVSNLREGIDVDKNIIFFVYSFQQLCLHSVNTGLIVFYCNHYQREVRYFTTLVQKLISVEKNETTLKKLHYFSAHLMHRNPQFTAYGFFSIDNSLGLTILGAVFTYLLILAQFSLTQLNVETVEDRG